VRGLNPADRRQIQPWAAFLNVFVILTKFSARSQVRVSQSTCVQPVYKSSQVYEAPNQSVSIQLYASATQVSAYRLPVLVTPS